MMFRACACERAVVHHRQPYKFVTGRRIDRQTADDRWMTLIVDTAAIRPRVLIALHSIAEQQQLQRSLPRVSELVNANTSKRAERHHERSTHVGR